MRHKDARLLIPVLILGVVVCTFFTGRLSRRRDEISSVFFLLFSGHFFSGTGRYISIDEPFW